MDSVSMWDVNDWGLVNYDPYFQEQIATPLGQNRTLEICQTIFAKAIQLQIIPASIVCPMSDFKDYITNKGGIFPVASVTDMKREWHDFLLDTTYGKLSSGLLLSASGPANQGYPIYYHGIRTSVDIFRWSPSNVKDPKYEQLELEIAQLNMQSLQSGFNSQGVITDKQGAWVYLRLEQALFEGAVQGVALALSASLLVLLVFTRSLTISIFAMLTIGGIFLSVINVITAFGWTLGIVESLALVVVIGFSIDYVIHFGHAYLGAKETVETRLGRTTMAVMTMAPSVSMGGATTFAGGAPLIITRITFFHKMGILMCSTVCLSLLWTLFFFVPLLLLFGPTNEKCCGGDSSPQQHEGRQLKNTSPGVLSPNDMTRVDSVFTVLSTATHSDDGS